jgi:hypothetical protein
MTTMYKLTALGIKKVEVDASFVIKPWDHYGDNAGVQASQAG